MKKYRYSLLSLLLPSLIHALTFSQEKIDEALKSADFIGSIKIEKIEPFDILQGIGHRSLATARVLSSTSENHPTNLKILFFGGEKEDRGSYFSGLPRPYVGHRYQVFLKKAGQDLFEITGFEFGLRDLEPKRNYSRNRTDGSNGQGNGAFLYWDSGYFPIPYYFAEPTFRDRPELISEIDESFKSWRNLETISIEFLAMGCSNAQYNENDGINSVILIKNSWPFDTSAIAITRNFYVTGTSPYAGLILDSDILLNAQHHQFSIGLETGKHDIRNIVTHEVGHFLGLGHEISPFNTEATMFAVASTEEVKKQTLDTTDIMAIEAAYRGVGQKLWNHGSTCTPSEQNNGCRLGVSRGTRSFPLTFLAGWLLILLQIPLARWWLQEFRT